MRPFIQHARKLVCLTVLVWTVAVQTGSAQDARATARAYQRLIDEAVVEFEASHFGEARALFARAHALTPNARTLRALGMVEFELRNYIDSSSYLEQALASQVKPLDGALRADTEQLLQRTRRFVGYLKLQVTPADAVLLIDGVATPYRAEHPLQLNIGEHTLELSAPGRHNERRTVQLVGGEERILQIALTPEQTAQPQESVPLRKNKWLWTGVGLAVVGLAVGLGVGLRRDDTRRPREAFGGDTGAVLVGP